MSSVLSKVSIITALSTLIVTFSGSLSVAQRDIASSCKPNQMNGPIELKVVMDSNLFILRAQYKLLPYPMMEDPRQFHMFENLDLSVNQVPVLISPASVSSLMALFGYTGKTQIKIQSYQPTKNSFTIDHELKVKPNAVGVHVEAIYIEEAFYRDCY